MQMREELIREAKIAREKAYTPHSRFKVGAALKGMSGTIYTGCNVENTSFSLTCCAERIAIFNAVSQGEQTFKALAVIADKSDVISPCGACRQVMAEFFTEDVDIILSNTNGIVQDTTISELLPFSFHL